VRKKKEKYIPIHSSTTFEVAPPDIYSWNRCKLFTIWSAHFLCNKICNPNGL